MQNNAMYNNATQCNVMLFWSRAATVTRCARVRRVTADVPKQRARVESTRVDERGRGERPLRAAPRHHLSLDRARTISRTPRATHRLAIDRLIQIHASAMSCDCFEKCWSIERFCGARPDTQCSRRRSNRRLVTGANGKSRGCDGERARRHARAALACAGRF